MSSSLPLGCDFATSLLTEAKHQGQIKTRMASRKLKFDVARVMSWNSGVSSLLVHLPSFFKDLYPS